MRGGHFNTPGKTTKKRVKTGVTSNNKGHNHTYSVDSDGEGHAAQGTTDADAHFHEIRAWKVETKHGHSHTIPRNM
jgi:hypothetical protein